MCGFSDFDGLLTGSSLHFTPGGLLISAAFSCLLSFWPHLRAPSPECRAERVNSALYPLRITKFAPQRKDGTSFSHGSVTRKRQPSHVPVISIAVRCCAFRLRRRPRIGPAVFGPERRLRAAPHQEVRLRCLNGELVDLLRGSWRLSPAPGRYAHSSCHRT